MPSTRTSHGGANGPLRVASDGRQNHREVRRQWPGQEVIGERKWTLGCARRDMGRNGSS